MVRLGSEKGKRGRNWKKEETKEGLTWYYYISYKPSDNAYKRLLPVLFSS